MKSNIQSFSQKMSSVAGTLRDEIKNFDKSNSYFEFARECEKDSVPEQLLAFMTLLM